MGNELTIIGMMSGTSMDGIDACLVKINDDFSFKVLGSHSAAYPDEITRKLLALANNNGSTAATAEICAMDFAVGKLFAKCANELIEKVKQQQSRQHFLKENIDLIASHGQTVWHIPKEATLQIGNISVIAEETGISTIGNFRARDIAAGGQGAPLVPFADEKIFKREIPRAIQNIGGIANVTVLSPDTATFAFDTGAGNMLIDYFTKKLFNLPFDKDGELASKGKINEDWLNSLLNLDYYRLEPPKTTGRELFGEEYAEKIFRSAPENPYDVIATVTALAAKTIADAYENFVFHKTKIREIVLGGGGAYNKTLIGYLKNYLPDIPIKTHEDFGIDNKYKEAIAFAFLGYCSAMKIPNSLPECTGAKKSVVMGEVAF